MKKIMFIVAFAIISLAVTGCKKDKQPTPEEMTAATKEKILGKWNLDSFYYESASPDGTVEKGTKEARKGDYFDFRADGKVYFVLNGVKEIRDTYSINNTTLKMSGTVYTIVTLSNNKLAYEITSVSSGKTVKQGNNLSR